ncbi:type II secretion system inner membrane protein GspF [Desulfosarcina ovata]|uniref:General secretion pathway protein F n=1 Tax=Desulfosarcina ovata subsp. ovata TaxID=2752305 RepID=A0A5K8A4K4_9BACT|nr:type II secretion system inner membrane protein GspF [Desulfosarcina ovata]BBO87472.1 type II secretion system protein GspF [Desulfosarcina ovata subsp. ovata]
MPVYEYQALDTKGKTITGIIDADGAQAARQKIRGMGGFPVSVKEVTEGTSAKESRMDALHGLFSRVKPAQVSLWTRQLATLTGAGFPLVSALTTLVSQTKTQGFTKVVARIKDAIVEGNSFASALTHFPSVFSQIYVNMVRAGETSGTLEIVLQRLADIMEKQQELKSRIQTALAYPILMTVIGTIVLFFLMTFVVPNITTIFEDMNQALPAPTRFLLAASDLFKSYWWLLLIVMAAGLVAMRMFRKTEHGLVVTDRFLLRLPVAGSLLRRIAVARFARTLASLLENGVTMLPALEIVRNITGNVIISDLIENASAEVERGQGLGVSLATDTVFPDLAVQMIQVGEQSGELEPMLYKIADVYENEVQASIMSMMAMLEPVIILVMAVVVLFIVLSICLPIFEMNQLVG